MSKRKQVGGQMNVQISNSNQTFNSIFNIYTYLFSSATGVSGNPLLILNRQVKVSFLPCYRFTEIKNTLGESANTVEGICFLEKKIPEIPTYQDCVRLIYSQGEDIIDTKFNKCLLDKIYPNNLTNIEVGDLLLDKVIKSLELKRRDRITSQQLSIISLEDENKILKQKNVAYDRENKKCEQDCQSELEQKSQECEQQKQLKLKEESQRYEQQQLMLNKERKEKIKQIITKVRSFVNGLEDEIEKKNIEIEKKENEIEELKEERIQGLITNEENTNIKENEIKELKKEEAKKKLKERLEKRRQAKLERENILELTLGEVDTQNAVAQ